MTADAAAAVASYDDRAAGYGNEVSAGLSRPSLLEGELNRARHVAELPCGAGHFLADYAAADVAVTLVDANPAMLAAAAGHAARVGLPQARLHLWRRYAQQFGDVAAQADLLVVPNAALNQLACQMPLPDLLTAIRRGLRPGTRLLMQVLLAHPDGTLDCCGCFDPAQPDRTWFTDRDLDPAADGACTRRRRQHRRGDRLHIDFDYRDSADRSMRTASADLLVLTAPRLRALLAATGYTAADLRPGRQHLSQVLAEADTRHPR